MPARPPPGLRPPPGPSPPPGSNPPLGPSVPLNNWYMASGLLWNLENIGNNAAVHLEEDAEPKDTAGEDSEGEDAAEEDAQGEDAEGEDIVEKDVEGEDAEGEDAEGEDDSGDQPDAKPRLSKRQRSHMDNVDMWINGRYLRDEKCAYDQDTLTNSGNYPKDKRLPRQMRQHRDYDEGIAPFQSSARLARYFSDSTLRPLIQKLSRHEVQPPSLAPAGPVDAVDSACETPHPLFISSPATSFDSALNLEDLISDSNAELTYAAAAPTAITSTSSAEGLQSFLKGFTEGFALICPLILFALLCLIITLKRASRQRRVARIKHELVGLYPSPVVETKGDLESGSV